MGGDFKTAGLSAKGNYSRHKGNEVRQDVGGGCHLRLFFEVIDIAMLFTDWLYVFHSSMRKSLHL